MTEQELQDAFEAVVAEMVPEASSDDPWTYDALAEGEPAYIGRRRRDG